MSAERISGLRMSGQQDGDGSRIVAGVDGWPSAMSALQWAIGQAG